MNYNRLTLQQKRGKLIATIKLPDNKYLNLVQLDTITKKQIKFSIIDTNNLNNCGIYTDSITALNDYYKKVSNYSNTFKDIQIKHINNITM